MYPSGVLSQHYGELKTDQSINTSQRPSDVVISMLSI